MTNKEKFLEWKQDHAKAAPGIIREGNTLETLDGFSVGDKVMFTNDFGLPFGPYEVLAIIKKPLGYQRHVFIDKDAYWFPVPTHSLKHIDS